MSKWFAFLLSSCIACALAPTPSAATTIAVGPYTPSSTSPFVVPVMVTGAVGLDAFSFDLAYEPTAYAIATGCDPFSDAFCDFVTGPVTAGTFYGGATFPALFVPGFILLDAGGVQTGRLLGVAGAWQDFAPSPSGDGILAYIEFIAIPGGTADSPITVTSSVLPVEVAEPATCALVAVSLAAMLSMTRRARRGERERPASPPLVAA